MFQKIRKNNERARTRQVAAHDLAIQYARTDVRISGTAYRIQSASGQQQAKRPSSVRFANQTVIKQSPDEEIGERWKKMA
jgi:hypothetical protein